MDFTINTHDQRILITCTQAELDNMAWLGQHIWGTPNAEAPGEPITQVYRGAQKQWMYDRVLATVADFEEKSGYLPIGETEALSDEELAEEFSITVAQCR